jgi:hypothetical protein
MPLDLGCQGGVLGLLAEFEICTKVGDRRFDGSPPGKKGFQRFPLFQERLRLLGRFPKTFLRNGRLDCRKPGSFPIYFKGNPGGT